MSEPIVVTLSWYEMNLASEVGRMRRLSAMRDGKPDNNLQSENNRWTDHLEGACAEMAVAKYLDRFWSASIDTYRQGADIGEDIEVRSSGRIKELCIRARDHDEKIFVKAYGLAPSFALFGWLPAKLGKLNAAWLHDRGNGGAPAYWVPTEALKPMAALRILLMIREGKEVGVE